jgi:hypothetical protein
MNVIGFLWESQKERGHYEDLDIGRRILNGSYRYRMGW